MNIETYKKYFSLMNNITETIGDAEMAKLLLLGQETYKLAITNEGIPVYITKNIEDDSVITVQST